MASRKKAEVRKSEILGCFYEIIVEQGIEGASIGRIAKRMNIHPSLIMHYFSTKENMIIELVDYIIDKYWSLLRNIRVEHADPDERLHELMDILWGDEWYRTTDISADFSVIAISFHNHEVSERLQRLYSRFKTYLCEEFRTFMDAGVIREQDPVHAAEIVLSMLEGYRHFNHFYVDKPRTGQYRQDMKRSALMFLRHGLDEQAAG